MQIQYKYLQQHKKPFHIIKNQIQNFQMLHKDIEDIMYCCKRDLVGHYGLLQANMTYLMVYIYIKVLIVPVTHNNPTPNVVNNKL